MQESVRKSNSMTECSRAARSSEQRGQIALLGDGLADFQQRLQADAGSVPAGR